MKEGTINAVVTTERYFDRTPDARVSTAGCFSYPFWTRFLAEFDSVRILAWTCKVLAAPAGFLTRQRLTYELIEIDSGSRWFAPFVNCESGTFTSTS
jgi:hypothetical protein